MTQTRVTLAAADHPCGRFLSLDVVRGLGAIFVVLFHWVHFFQFPSQLSIQFDARLLPLDGWIRPIYENGWLAVDLFFCLSGFIFFLLYSRNVADRRVSVVQFAMRRFARLYPMHLLTLFVVTFLQRWMGNNYGCPFIYQCNDAKHFALNLLFANCWGIETSYSFNAPSWSVSVEILLYVLFFVFCRYVRVCWPALLAVAVFGVVLRQFNEPLGRGISSFFFGGCGSLMYQFAVQRKSLSLRFDRGYKLLLTASVGCIAAMFWTACSLEFPLHFPESVVHLMNGRIFDVWLTGIVFPGIILALAILDPWLSSLCRPIAFLGDISYSLYLLHFPMQLVFAAAVDQIWMDHSLFYSPYFMMLYFSCLILTSIVTFHFFEMPLQRSLRQITRI